MSAAVARIEPPEAGEAVGGHTDAVAGSAEPAPGCDACRELAIERNRLRNQAGYWRAMHRNAVEREQKLKEEMEALEAKLRLRERQLFERKTERRPKKKAEQGGGSGRSNDSPRPRGHQKGTAGHGRRHHDHLPARTEEHDLPDSEKVCPACGDPLIPEGGSETSEVIEVEVRAHRRIIKRRRHRRTCRCTGLPKVIAAPPAPKLFPKGAYGISFWALILLEKFVFQRPLHRALAALKVSCHLDVSRGTVTDGLERLLPLFKPLYEGIIAESRAAPTAHWHADETRWFVFVDEHGVGGYRTWWLWVFRSSTAVVFRVDETRSASVPLEHFDRDVCGILSVDRYSAYKATLEKLMLQLAFCWAHVRRDFFAVAKDWPQHEAWALQWIQDIAGLYRLNDERLQELEGTEARRSAQRSLEEAIAAMAERRDRELGEATIHAARRKVLESLANHWEGLTLLVTYPDVPMDNNAAERELREEVVGRRNYHGSGAPWSARLAAMLFSVFRTLKLWNIDVHLWLTEYLTACARNGGQPPPDPASFLPWKLAPDELARLRSPIPATKDTS